MSLAAGARLGPYEVVELLGAGGMGEVYRARDPRLGRDVAVKVLPEEVASDAQRLAFFEREARAVAALNHPNILTVFDVGTHKGVPYVVTELLEGENVRELVSRRSPTVKQILGYALQAARGLEAAHAKDIVHRDLKPENLFLTTDGRVKVLDFGLAKLVRREEVHTEAPTPSRSGDPGQIVGTVAYMSPEQARGYPVDARSDVFSFGVVLYELLARTHPFRRKTAAATLAAILDETPVDLESLSRGIPPAAGGIVRRCLEKAREDRYGSGHDVVVALDTVLAAPSEAVSLLEVEERSPYPGLSSFTEKDAGVFFGREREIEELWRRIHARKLLAVIGPSGAGKTSLVRAGVMASRPEGWTAMVVTPGAQPFRGLGRALGPELAGDTEALARLADVEDPEVAVALLGRWRRDATEALLVVDQFEELFTLNSPETQERFSTLLARLASETDVHVLLSLRDDFLMRCHEQEPLARVFTELTPLGALTAAGLERALVGPGKKRGYGFEDDALVDEMVSLVEGVRGALPLLAFAVARLWEKRDRERKLLTREAYQEIAGVEGALAQHAEATMDRIGSERQGLVREIFRNLVTAQGTRAVMDRAELLSAFPEREEAEAVLSQLIDARLLTSYEVEGKEGEPSRHRIEVVHESLLKAWPRLVRWQTQDEDSAQLRDQLKQAARLWDEKGRTPDLLWSGTAFREFELWQERYPGKLTALEEDFSDSMRKRAQRRRRLRRGAVAAAFLVLAGVAGAIGISRQQAARARDQAQAEARRAEAGKLVALARNEIERYPTAALAYARQSLELADTAEARRLVVEVLWRAPVARVLPVDRIARQMGVPDGVYFLYTALSPDGLWLATRSEGGHVLLFPADGGPPRALPAPRDGGPSVLAFTPEGHRLVTGGPGQSLRLLSLPDLQETRRVELGGVRSYGWVLNETLVTFTRMSSEDATPLIRAWPLAEGEPTIVGRRDWAGPWDIDAGGRIAFGRERTLLVRPLDASPPSAARVIGRLSADPEDVALLGEKGLVSVDTSGEVRLWSGDGFSSRVLAPADEARFDVLAVDREGRRLAVSRLHAAVDLHDLGDPPDAAPVRLDRPDPFFGLTAAFDPHGTWLATNNAHTVAFWSLASPWRRTLRHQGGLTMSRMTFSSDGRWMVSTAGPSLWSLDPED
ncbi:MAG: protein kinase, partial [Acidobacteriota bacterium]